MCVLKCVRLNGVMSSKSVRSRTVVCDVGDVEATCTVHVVGFKVDPEAP